MSGSPRFDFAGPPLGHVVREIPVGIGAGGVVETAAQREHPYVWTVTLRFGDGDGAVVRALEEDIFESGSWRSRKALAA